MKLTKQQTYLVAVAVVLLVALAAGAAVLATGGTDETADENGSADTTQSTESSWTIEATGSAEATSPVDTPAEQPPAQTPPTFVRYAHVTSVEGPATNRYAVLDFFEILLEDEARAYAQTHGMESPSNGILYVNETVDAERVPLASSVAIVYATGGVEALAQKPATPDQLAAWAAGDETAMPGAMTNRWKVTVETGILVRLEMVVIAD